MTYTEWRDELKDNLLCVSENERRRVLDYYAEAYADRREAGFTEREIIADFGAPYDAAQRILYEKVDDSEFYSEEPTEKTRREIKRENRERRREEQNARGEQNAQPSYTPPQPDYSQPAPTPAPASANKDDYTWVFVLLCVIFCVPLFGLIMTMVGITIGFCVAPVAVIAGGAVAIGTSFAPIIGGELSYGLYSLAGGIIAVGVGIALCPICFKLVGLMWKLFKIVFGWIKSLFSGKKEKAV